MAPNLSESGTLDPKLVLGVADRKKGSPSSNKQFRVKLSHYIRPGGPGPPGRPASSTAARTWMTWAPRVDISTRSPSEEDVAKGAILAISL